MAETSHTRSHIKGLGTVHIRNFNIKSASLAATVLTSGTSITSSGYAAVSGNAAAGNYIKLGNHQYIFWGTKNLEATVVSEATAVDASVKGSLYMSSQGALWIYDGDATATKLALT